MVKEVQGIGQTHCNPTAPRIAESSDHGGVFLNSRNCSYGHANSANTFFSAFDSGSGDLGLMKKFEKRRKAQRSGFTLIELVMVVMILAIVAGLAVPVVGWLRRSANYSAQANTTSALASNMEFYRTTYGNNAYPDRMDSLLKADGTLIDYTDGGWGDLFVAGSITGQALDCLKPMKFVYDHTDTAFEGLQGNPGNTATIPRAFYGGADPALCAVVDVDGTDEPAKLLNELYPGATVDAATNTITYNGDVITLVGFGIGQSNTAVGRTMASAPLDPRVDNSEVYGRYTAIFAVYETRKGRRAQLKAIVNAKGRTTNNALSEFNQSLTPE